MATVTPMIMIDLHSAVPSYRQLAAILGARIRSGELAAGEALPSITALAQETGLAVTTVRRAISLLIDEGLAHNVPGRATYAGPRGWRPGQVPPGQDHAATSSVSGEAGRWSDGLQPPARMMRHMAGTACPERFP